MHPYWDLNFGLLFVSLSVLPLHHTRGGNIDETLDQTKGGSPTMVRLIIQPKLLTNLKQWKGSTM